MYFVQPTIATVPGSIPVGHVRPGSYMASGLPVSHVMAPAYGINNFAPTGVHSSFIGGAPLVYGAGGPIQTSSVLRSGPLRRTGEYLPITQEEVLAKIKEVEREVSDEEKRDIYRVGSNYRTYKQDPIRVEDSNYDQHLQDAENIFEKYRSPYDRRLITELVGNNSSAPSNTLTKEEFDNRRQLENQSMRFPESNAFPHSISMVESKIIDDGGRPVEERRWQESRQIQSSTIGGPYFHSYQQPVYNTAVAQQVRLNESQAKLNKLMPKYTGAAINEGVLIQGGVAIDIPSLFRAPPQEIIFQGYSTDEDRK